MKPRPGAPPPRGRPYKLTLGNLVSYPEKIHAAAIKLHLLDNFILCCFSYLPYMIGACRNFFLGTEVHQGRAYKGVAS